MVERIYPLLLMSGKESSGSNPSGGAAGRVKINYYTVELITTVSSFTELVVA